MEKKPMSQMTTRERQIESAFGWLRDVKVMDVDGKKMMINDETQLPFNVADAIPEDEFIRDWLMLFALGREHGLNYFPTAEWIEISKDGLQSVMVVEEGTGKPLFLIPPLVATNMGPAEQKMLRNLEQAIKQIAANEQLKHNPDASAHLAHDVETGLANVKPKTVTDMIPDWYYAKKGIIPEVEKQVNYIRQRVNPKATDEELNRARPILYREYRKEKNSEEDKKFVIELTNGEFSFGNHVPSETAVQQADQGKAEPDAEYDPLEC